MPTDGVPKESKRPKRLVLSPVLDTGAGDSTLVGTASEPTKNPGTEANPAEESSDAQQAWSEAAAEPTHSHLGGLSSNPLAEPSAGGSICSNEQEEEIRNNVLNMREQDEISEPATEIPDAEMSQNEGDGTQKEIETRQDPEKEADTQPDEKAETRPEKEADTQTDEKAETRPEKEADTQPDQKAETRPDEKKESKTNPGNMQEGDEQMESIESESQKEEVKAKESIKSAPKVPNETQATPDRIIEEHVDEPPTGTILEDGGTNWISHQATEAAEDFEADFAEEAVQTTQADVSAQVPVVLPSSVALEPKGLAQALPEEREKVDSDNESEGIKTNDELSDIEDWVPANDRWDKDFCWTCKKGRDSHKNGVFCKTKPELRLQCMKAHYYAQAREKARKVTSIVVQKERKGDDIIIRLYNKKHRDKKITKRWKVKDGPCPYRKGERVKHIFFPDFRKRDISKTQKHNEALRGKRFHL